MSETEQRVAEVAEVARGATFLILAEASQRGFLRTLESGAWDLQPGAAALVKFLIVETRALQALGLERRAKPVQSLQEYLASKYGAQDAPGSARPPEPEANDSGQSQLSTQAQGGPHDHGER